jgi:hypothetical protein
MMLTINGRVKCDDCGQFVSNWDLEQERAIIEFAPPIPNTAYPDPEEWVYVYCPRCARQRDP